MNSHPTGGFFLPDVLVIRVTGEKAAVFLNGQFTNDIKNLKDGEANYNLFLTQKGKIIADLTVHRMGDDFLLVIPKPFAATVMEHLLRLAPLSRIILTNKTERIVVLHVLSPSPQPPPLKGGGMSKEIPSPLLGEGQGQGEGRLTFGINRLGIEGTDFVVPRNKEDKLLAALEKNGLSELNAETQETIRVENGVARVGVDATEENLPQEAGLMRAISLTKGCYLGQEVVARLHYRGHVNKILVGIKIDGPLPMVGNPIFDADNEVGKITSAVFSTTLNAPLALGYVPYQKREPGNTFVIRHAKGVVAKLPIRQS